MKQIAISICCIVFSAFIMSGIFSMFHTAESLTDKTIYVDQKFKVEYTDREILIYRPYDVTPSMLWEHTVDPVHKKSIPEEFDTLSDAVNSVCRSFDH